MRRLLHSLIRKFENQNKYDAAYMHHITAQSRGATVRLLMFSAMTDFRGDNIDVWAGAALKSTLSGDCGPCAQLSLDRSIQLGVNAKKLQACLSEDWPLAQDVGLGFRFASAVLSNCDSIQVLREEIRTKHGETSLIAASYATSCFQTYPLIKRSLGYDLECRQLLINDQTVRYSHE